MITHIVLFKLKNNYTTVEKMFAKEIIRKELERLPFLITQIKSLKVIENITEKENAAEIGIISEFSDLNDLETYLNHPAHKKVVDIINEHKEFSIFLDF